MGGKKRVSCTALQVDKTVVGSRTRTLSDGTKINAVIHAPRLQAAEYVCEWCIVKDGVSKTFLTEDFSSLEALGLVLTYLPDEMEANRFVSDSVQPTGFEFWHEDPDLNSLFTHLCEFEGRQSLLWRDTIVRGRIHGELDDVEQIGPKAVATLDGIDTMSPLWSKILRIRQRIRIRIVALAGRGNSEYWKHSLFADSRVPVIRKIPPTRTVGAPMATCTRFAQETEKAINISVWAPRLKTGSLPWRCEYRIDGLGTTIFAEVLAIDSMKALRDVIDAIADELDNSWLTIALTRDCLDQCPDSSYHGFDRYGDQHTTLLMQHLIAIEIQRNIILYKHAIGQQGLEGESEDKLHFHLREVERIRSTFDPNYCAGNLKYPSGVD